MGSEPPIQNPKSAAQEPAPPALQDEILKIIRAHANGDAEKLEQALAPLLQRADVRAREIAKSEERYRAIVENAADPIFMTDPAGRLTWANRATCSALGYLRQELTGMNLNRIVKKGHMHKMFTALRDALEGREVKPFQLEIMTKSGEERTVEFACMGVRENGKGTAMEATLRDITDRVLIDKLKKNYMKSLEEAAA